MASTIESMRQWFRTCPLLSGNRIGANYLGEKPASFAVIAYPSSITTHENVLGEDVPDELQQLNFQFAATDSFGADITVNTAAQKLYDDIVQWILEKNAKKQFPVIELGKVKSITPTLTAYPSQVGTDTAVYRIQLRLIYRRS